MASASNIVDEIIRKIRGISIIHSIYLPPNNIDRHFTIDALIRLKEQQKILEIHQEVLEQMSKRHLFHGISDRQ